MDPPTRARPGGKMTSDPKETDLLSPGAPESVPGQRTLQQDGGQEFRPDLKARPTGTNSAASHTCHRQQ